MPDKLKEMQALFLTEAAKYNVFPLDNTAFSRLADAATERGRRAELFSPTRVRMPAFPSAMRPSILDKDYTITAEVTVPEGGAEGMIVTLGGRFGGYGLYLLKGKPVFVYNLLDLERFRWEGGVGEPAIGWAGRRSSPASTRSCSTSNTTAPAPARAAPACSRWMARNWPARRSRTRFRS